MKLVQFENSLYGIRKFNLFEMKYQFLDLNDPDYWWGSRDHIA